VAYGTRGILGKELATALTQKVTFDFCTLRVSQEGPRSGERSYGAPDDGLSVFIVPRWLILVTFGLCTLRVSQGGPRSGERSYGAPDDGVSVFIVPRWLISLTFGLCTLRVKSGGTAFWRTQLRRERHDFVCKWCLDKEGPF
jgi:hypothetical protein